MTELTLHPDTLRGLDPQSDFQDLIRQSEDLFAVFDSEDRLRFANPAFCAAYHCDPAGQPSWRQIMQENHIQRRGAVIGTADIEGWLTSAAAHRGTSAYRAFELALHGGRWLWATETVTPDGRMLFYATDVSSLRSESRALRKERDAAQRASWTDPLTGVPNRRYVTERLEEFLEHQRDEPEFGDHALAVLDLDHFKQVNDVHGHGVGDAVLVSFCRTVVNSVRTVDLFGRFGGEEFLLFMPNCRIEVARQRLEGLQDEIARSVNNVDHPSVAYTFSAGVVALRPDRDIHHSIRRADKLLYRAKEDGRACVRG
ncbi:diguanylate cyclase [Cereibacter changlensis]|jgi:diguanylate cyclase (GGDEF)-like protein|uniref:diguanylate cyclase n=1 Tax=Cereibacter changlensis TaxID=402884 RepID=A0A4V5NPF2_9RHOB|nr:sensor domain-containing diguanylate cyclase [Cereibacter changlensis]MBZ4690208.1 diguanylate cyclase [Cereibacter sp.]TKA96387.1 diguanylate cyclase [Cereibacter changlensis]